MLNLREHLLTGQVIPVHPLALDSGRKLDERRQRGLTRYYVASGAGGIAVGGYVTQLEIRLPQFGLLRPVLELAAAAADEALAQTPRDFVKIAGLAGETEQAAREAELARSLGYDAGLLSLGKLRNAREDELIAHCRAVGDVIPLIGSSVLPAMGGRLLSYRFWRRFAEIPNVAAIQIAGLNRYQTLEVVRAVAESGRRDIALYTGNDDNIVSDLLTPFVFAGRTLHMAGGLLGHWAVWTRRAVELLNDIKAARGESTLAANWLSRAAEATDANSAIFDAANQFRGCISGIHEVLRRQGLLAQIGCLNPEERLSPGQAAEIDRVYAAYPPMNDDSFVRDHLGAWMQ